MHSEVRRPAKVNLDRFVASLDQRLRDEVRVTRRARLPMAVSRFMRAVKIRSLALLQGGAMALTALAVIVAVGFAPEVGSGSPPYPSDPLAEPAVHTDSMLLVKTSPSALLATIGAPDSAPVVRGIFE